MNPVQVILADDHALFRQGLARLLSAESDITITAQASTGREVLDRLRAKRVDVVLMDITMPDVDGIKATRSIVERYPSVKVLILSGREDRDALFSAIEAGAKGYVLKDADPEELAQAIRVVAEGGSFVSASVTPKLLEGVREMGYDPVFSERRRFSLSGREADILDQLITSKSPAQIGRELYISTKTVQNHIANIYRKLDVSTRTEAIARAEALGLIPHDRVLEEDV